MNKRWIFSLVLVGTVVSLVFAGCATTTTSTPTSEEETIHIVALTELSGPTASPQGTGMLAGYYLARDEINDAGGILGKDVRVTVLHEGYMTEDVIGAYKKAVSLKPNAIVCGIEAGTMDAGAPVLRDSGIPSVHVYGSAMKLSTPGFYDRGFRVNNNPAQYFLPLKKFVEDGGYASIGILQIDAGYGHQAADVIRGWWPAGGPIEITDVQFYTWGSEDLEMELLKLVNSGPEVLFMGAWGDALLGNTLKKLNELGYEGEIVTDCDVTQVHHATGELAELVDGTYCVYMWLPVESIPASWEFAEAMRENYSLSPTSFSSTAYMAMKSILLAMEKAGTADDPAKIADAMYELDFTTVFGDEFWLFPGGQLYQSWAALGQVKDGAIVPAIIGEISKEDYNEPVAWYDAYMAGEKR